MRSSLSLIGWLGLSLAAGAIGAAASKPGAWYAALSKPPWTPPSWLFAPVWTLLYIAMGVAAWLVWRERGAAPVGVAIGLFLAQLALNALWSWLFFAWHRLDLAAVEIVVLWVAIAATIVAFWRVRPAAGALLLPYLAWVSFATALTVAIWRRNPA
ncbi:MAG TPA: TspO/MBR family protein [Gemmatimonadales bacterium]|nr:TspO/MBR family protein [Gemmatimonadales bacterium]